MAEMTLQEAIDHAREVANGLHPNIDGCSECAKQHGQLADWLEELQEFRRVGATPADVRPVVHGRWVKVGGFFTPGGDPVWRCSECGKGRHVFGIEHGTYGADVSDGQWLACPNCMAIMEGEGDG